MSCSASDWKEAVSWRAAPFSLSSYRLQNNNLNEMLPSAFEICLRAISFPAFPVDIFIFMSRARKQQEGITTNWKSSEVVSEHNAVKMGDVSKIYDHHIIKIFSRLTL